MADDIVLNTNIDDVKEVQLQFALGTVSEQLFYHTVDIEVIKLVAERPEPKFRRAVAVNKNTPFSILKKLYTEDTDPLTQECAWEHVVERFRRRFFREPPRKPWDHRTYYNVGIPPWYPQ